VSVPALMLKCEYVVSDVTDLLRQLLDEKVQKLYLLRNMLILKKVK
jgi:hypothetical protein